MITGQQVLENQKLFKRLKDSHFHKLDEQGKIQHQGCVLAVKGKMFQVQRYDWLVGAPVEHTTWVSQLELELYRFYDSDVEMRQAYAEEAA